MASKMIKAQKQLLSRMFYLRGLVGSGRSFNFLLALLSVVFILVACNECPVNEAGNQFSSSPLLEEMTESSSSSKNNNVEVGISDGFQPPVAISPPQLDWGHKSKINPSIAYLTVKNIDAGIVLSVYDLYSSSSQFYPCNAFSEILLPPGEYARTCFVVPPANLTIELPYLMKPLYSCSSERWRKNLSLFKSFHEALYVKDAISCIEDSSEYSCKLNIENRLVFKTVDIGRHRLHENWEASPWEAGGILDLDIYVELLRSSNNDIDGLMVQPLDAEASYTSHVSIYTNAYAPCRIGGSIVFSISVRKDASNLLRIIKVNEVGESIETFQMIKSGEELIHFPDSITQVAFFNGTRTSCMEIPFIDVIKVWRRMKRSMAVMLLTAFLLCFLFFVLLFHVSAIPSRDFERGDGLVFLSRMRFGWEKLRFLRSTQLDKTDDQETIPPPSGLLSPSSVENVDKQDALEPQNLRVKLGKGRRRRKKKGNAKIYQFEASSSQSSNSTPPSPLSPQQKNPPSKVIPKRDQSDQCSEVSSKVNLLDNKVHLPTTREKPSLENTKLLSPHARAPGTKLDHKTKKASGVEEKKGFDEQTYISYDIWADHLFGLSPLAFYQGKKEGNGKSLSGFQNNDSESFFVRGPQTLFEKPCATFCW